MTKIKIKHGQIEIELEGSEEFIKNEFEKILKNVATLGPVVNIDERRPESEEASGGAALGQQLSTNTIASRIGAKTGADLVIASVFRLMAFGGKSTISRKELTTEMRTATTFFKKTYVGNLSATIAALIKDNQILESSPGVYALHESTLGNIRKMIYG